MGVFRLFNLSWSDLEGDLTQNGTGAGPEPTRTNGPYAGPSEVQLGTARTGNHPPNDQEGPVGNAAAAAGLARPCQPWPTRKPTTYTAGLGRKRGAELGGHK